MSKNKFSELPKRALDSLIRVEKKIVSYPVEEKYKRFKEKFQDIKENRELIVVDKYGNRYYQYYSYHGLPTRRVVINNLKGFNKWDDDPLMSGWLQKRRAIPPTQEELEKMYIEQEEFARRGLEWDRQQQAMIDAWKSKQKEALEKERKETGAIGDGMSFEPGAWNRKIEKTENISLNNSTIDPGQELVEVKETEGKVIEGQSTLPGKYIMDWRIEDEKWMEQQKMKKLKPYLEIEKQIDWSEYTLEKMVERNNKNTLEARTKIHNKQQELTNLGKKMLEKKKTYQRYNDFRERFKDVFEDSKYSAL
jgi:hypothetical protein